MFIADKPQGKENPALIIGKGVHSRLEGFGATEDLVLVRDTTSTNTEPEGGAIHYLEQLLGHKVHWDICLIHINELLLKRMMIKLDGKYIPKSGWTGPIGKLLEKINDLKRLSTFPALADTNGIRDASRDSTDYQQIRRTAIN